MRAGGLPAARIGSRKACTQTEAGPANRTAPQCYAGNLKAPFLAVSRRQAPPRRLRPGPRHGRLTRLRSRRFRADPEGPSPVFASRRSWEKAQEARAYLENAENRLKLPKRGY